MKIGILQPGHNSESLRVEHGDYAEMFGRLFVGQEFSFHVYPVVDGVFPEGADAADGWLITGSRHGAYEDHPWIARLEALVREIYASGRPMVGICFGHQIIAQALGGKVEKFDGGWSVGRVDYQIGGENLSINAFHQDQVTELPDGAEVVGSNDFCRYAMLRYEGKALTIQPHPEFSPPMMADLIEARREILGDDIADAAQARAGAVQSHAIGVQLADFLKAGHAARLAALDVSAA